MKMYSLRDRQAQRQSADQAGHNKKPKVRKFAMHQRAMPFFSTGILPQGSAIKGIAAGMGRTPLYAELGVRIHKPTGAEAFS
jgi:hypothetical protein